MHEKGSLYERIGGESAVKMTVVKLYEKILEDELLAPFFEDVDVDTLRRSQAAFVSYAFGGPNDYQGKNLRIVHEKSVKNGLSDQHFDAVADHLKASMEELGVSGELINEALEIVGSTRDDVLNR